MAVCIESLCLRSWPPSKRYSPGERRDFKSVQQLYSEEKMRIEQYK